MSHSQPTLIQNPKSRLCLRHLRVSTSALLTNDKWHYGPAIAVIECPNVHLMKSSIRALNDFSRVNIPSNARDSQYQVLWISDNDTPDLRGINKEESCYTDDVNQHVLTDLGAYRKVTVELKIHNLAVNALLKSNQVNEMEGGALFGFEYDSSTGPHGFNEQSGFDEAISCAPAFQPTVKTSRPSSVSHAS